MKIEDAINLLNKAFVKSPTSDIEATVRFWKVFDPVKTSQDVHWPSAEKKDAQQTDSADRQ